MERLLSDEQRIDWLRLIMSENVGPATFRTLINRFGGAAQALAALPDLYRRGGLSGGHRIYGREEALRDIERADALGALVVERPAQRAGRGERLDLDYRWHRSPR